MRENLETNKEISNDDIWYLAYELKFDVLEKLIEQKGVDFIDLNTIPLVENYSGNKGKTLGWLLGDADQWGLLKKIAGNRSVDVDLNAAPLAKSNNYKGVTLGWILARAKQWELLREIASNQYYSGVIDLNAAPDAKNNSYQGVSLAWCLVFDRQFDLLKSLAKQKKQPIDLNLAPKSRRHPNQGMTLGLLVCAHKEWQYLEKLIDSKEAIPVNPNLAITADSHIDKGMTLAWGLAYSQQFDLLKKLSDKKLSESINLYTIPLAESNSCKKTIKELLLANQQYDLFLQIVKKHITHDPKQAVLLIQKLGESLSKKHPDLIKNLLEGCELEFLLDLINTLPEGEILWLSKLIAAEKIHETIKLPMAMYQTIFEAQKKSLHDQLILIFKLLTQISINNSALPLEYYKQAQNKLAHLIMAIESYKNENFTQFLVQQVNQFIPLTHLSSFYNFSDKSLIRQTFLMCLGKAQNFELLSNALAEFEQEKQALELENKNLKRKISELEAIQQPVTEVNLSKKQKLIADSAQNILSQCSNHSRDLDVKQKSSEADIKSETQKKLGSGVEFFNVLTPKINCGKDEAVNQMVLNPVLGSH